MHEEKQSSRRLQTSYVITTVSLTLVLLLIGIMGLLLINVHKISQHVKESIGLSIIMHDNVKEADIIRLQKSFETQPYVRTTRYISKEQAAEELQQGLGEDFVEFIGFLEYNPLPVSIEIKLTADYANNDSIRMIENSIRRSEHIKEVWYQKNLIYLINQNIQKISIVVLGFAILLLLISLVLINNTIQLAVYSKRFLINTMKLVGATANFIRRPFLTTSIIYGIISGLFAVLLISGMIYLTGKEFPEIGILNKIEMGFLFLMMLVIAVIISLSSTFIAVNKFLRIKIDKLYN